MRAIVAEVVVNPTAVHAYASLCVAKKGVAHGLPRLVDVALHCTGGGAEINLASRIFSVPGYAGGQVKELGDRLQVRSRVGLRRNNFRDGGECGDSRLADLGGQGRRLKRGVDLEGDRLVVEIQRMLVGADAGIGVLGGVVIVQGDVEVPVGHFG